MNSFHPHTANTPLLPPTDTQRALTTTLPTLPTMPSALNPQPVLFPFSQSSSEQTVSYRRKLALKIQAFVI